ncbi:hypothetical protein KUTeg_010867 [Tegillarca granosa]|uniref:Ion transport domain-containing protein n=1 Tax=Tegillarca granosa TaxID=220873 RepID=A0ABQ9F2A9_TEGGR|nr:hypothetical protein KUTeg_010867 [Tegillarca granosa]
MFETFTNPGNNAKDYKAAAESVHYTLLKGSCLMSSCFNIGGTKCCMPCCVKPKETKDTETRNSDILLKYMVTGDYDRLGILWSNCDTPMYTALIVSRTMRALSELAVEMAEDKWVETFKEQEQLFSNRAIFILEKLSEEFPDTTAKALTHDSEVWGIKDSPIHFSKTFAMEEFSAHSVAHKDANCTLYGAKQINTFWDFIHRHAITETSTKIFSAPLTRIIVNLILHIAALVCYSVFLITDVRMETISSLIIVVFVFVIGDLYEELKFLKRRVWKHFSFKMILLHFNDIWRSMDLIFWILFLIGFFMHASKIEELYLHTRRIYSVALFLMFMRLLKMMLMIRSLGIMVIMVKEMLKDLLKFLMVASVFMFAAGIIYHANIYPNHTYSAFSFDNWRFWQLLKIPYWQIYGELYLDTLEGSDGTDCTNNETIWSTDPTAERCSEYDWLAIFIAAVYMMLVNWLLLNIVIAMFSSQYERVHSTSEQKWRHHRNIVVTDYQHRIPSPINLIIRPIKILIIGCVVGANACARKHETPELSTQDLDNQRKFAKTRIEEEEQLMKGERRKTQTEHIQISFRQSRKQRTTTLKQNIN